MLTLPLRLSKKAFDIKRKCSINRENVLILVYIISEDLPRLDYQNYFLHVLSLFKCNFKRIKIETRK